MGGVMVKQYYQQMVRSVTTEDEHAERCEMDLEQFEEDMKEMLEVRTSSCAVKVVDIYLCCFQGDN